MANEKQIKARFQQKHDIEANWNKALNFIPKIGEIIVYDIDDNYNYSRIKIGDGINNANVLPFAHSASMVVQNNVPIDTSVIWVDTDDNTVDEFSGGDAVLYVEQTLTPEQKAQARQNIGITGAGESVPDYVIAEAKETAKKVLSHQSEDCFTLAWLSDLHIGSSYKIDGAWVTDDTSIIEAGQGLHEMSKTAPCDMIALGGDLASGTIMTQHDDGLNQLDACMEYLRPATFHTPSLYLVGNHDDVPWRATADRLSRAELFSRFGKKNLLAGAETNGKDKGCNYGYLDFENRKMRVIYLDTHDKNGWESTNRVQGTDTNSDYMDACNVSAKQLHWLANVALDFSEKESPSDWGVVVLSHTQLDIHNGNLTYTANGKTYTANTDNVIKVLTDYLSKANGSITLNGETATYDFSGITEKANLYCCINGHRHCYEFREYGGKKIPGITCPNTRDGSERVSDDGKTYTKTPGTGESCSINVITIDRKNGKIYADNHGAGIDREWDVVVYTSYKNLVPTAITPPKANNEQPSTEIFNGGLGYKNDTRISAMDNIPAATGYVTTGIMTWRENPGAFSELKPIYIKGADLDITKSYVRMCLIHNIDNAGLYCAKVMNSGANWEDYFNIETLGDQYYKLTPIESGTNWYNIRYFMISLLGSGENLIITVDEPISGGSQIETLTVTNQLTNATTTNTASTIQKGSVYNATISANNGYKLDTVTVTMGGSDITSTACNNGVISINSVTGNLVITASASADVANYTNLVSLSTTPPASGGQPIEEIYNGGLGYKNDTRISGMDDSSGSGYVATGCVPYTRKSDGTFGTIYIKGATLDTTLSNVRMTTLQYVSSEGVKPNKMMVGNSTNTTTMWSTYFDIETLGDKYYKLTPTSGAGFSANIFAFRMSLIGSGENLIITVDEPIE